MRDLRPEAAVHASERLTGRHLIQTPFDEFGADAADPSVMTERDAVKLAKRAEKEEKAQRAAFAAHQVCPSPSSCCMSRCLVSDMYNNQ